MRLHSAPRSGNSYKVRLLLGLLGTRYEIINYDTKGGETHTPEFLENVNPDGKVPVLELEDGTMLPESGAILYYLAEGTPYLPEGKLERAQVLRWMFFEQYSLLPNLSRPRLWRMWQIQMTPQKEAELEQFFEQGYKALSVMEGHLSDHEFLVEDRPTVADVALYVYPSVGHEGGFDLESYQAVGIWMERVAALPGYVPLKPPSQQGEEEAQLIEIDKADDNWQENGLVFCTGKGTLINPTNLRKRSLAPLLQRAGLAPMTFHQLRHTAATILLLKNVNPKVVSEMLGHATIAITLDTYSHVLPNMQHSAIAAMEEAFS